MNAPMVFICDNPAIKHVRIDYTNYKDERAFRLIHPIRIQFDSTTWHPEPQFLLEAYDIDKHVHRTFACKNIHSWIEE